MAVALRGIRRLKLAEETRARLEGGVRDLGNLPDLQEFLVWGTGRALRGFRAPEVFDWVLRLWLRSLVPHKALEVRSLFLF